MNALSRRRFLQVGALSTVGLSLPQLLEAEARAASPKRRVKSCIFIFLYGGPSQLDTFDMKPDAPLEIRGEFKPIQTSVAGTHIVEHLPKTAQLAQHFSIVRTLYHNKRNHQPASSFMLTGVDPLVDNAGALAPKPDDPPALGSLVLRAAPPDGGVPPFVMMPARMNDQGSVHRGQTGGWLGSPYDPMLIAQDPNASVFKVQGMAPADGMPPDRMAGRQQLLAVLDRQVGDLDAAVRAMSVMQQRAFDMLTSGKGQTAFKLDEEKASVRDRYGRHTFGQGLLLARRLIEAGSRLVTVSDCSGGGGHEWDTHGANFKKLKGTLLPRFDQSFTALLQDLLDRGMLNDTVVYVGGEFGRTPKIGYANATFASPDGRDHYPGCFFSLLAGGRTNPGMVHGQSDSKAGSPARDPVTPEDMTATLFAAMGLDPEMHILSRDNRPMALT
ncbi:MAG: DUF1501 domain-containing protein, partial [Planctomycetia bacterium]|nr:DUF1501 domain-containing protein [Planctomycetia bacterium]